METVKEVIYHSVFREMLRKESDNDRVLYLNEMYKTWVNQTCKDLSTNAYEVLVKKCAYEILARKYDEEISKNDVKIYDVIVSLLYMTCVYEERISWTDKIRENNMFGMHWNVINEIFKALMRNE